MPVCAHTALSVGVFIGLSQMGGSAPPHPPQGPQMLPPTLPPTVGGSHRNFHFGKFWKCSPQAPKTPPPFGLFWSKVPPTVGGSTPKSVICSPPLWGGAAHFFKKASKTRDVTAPPQAPKSPPHFTQSPPHLCRSFGGRCSPPRVPGWGGDSPPFSLLPPTVGGTEHP